MQGPKKFAFDFGFTFTSSIVNLLFGFVIMVVLGRYLGAGDLGLFRMAGTIYGIWTLFAFMGVPSAIIKFVAESIDDRKKMNLIISAGLITSIILGIVSTLLMYFGSGIFERIFNMPGLSDLLKTYSPIFPFAIMNAVLMGILNGLREMKKFAISLIIQSILLLVISVPLIYWGFGAGGAVIGVVLSTVGMWVNLMWVSRVYFNFTLDEYVQNSKQLLQFGIKVFAAGSINFVNNQVDILLIGFYLTSADLGYYSVAIGLSSFFQLIPAAVQKNTYPATSLYWHQKEYFALNNMLNKSMKYCTVVLVPIGLLLGFFAQEIILLIYHKGDFIAAVLPLQILLIGTVIKGSTYQPIGGSLVGIGKPGIDMITVIVITIINITLDIILLTRIGIAGAAIATSISLTVGSLMGIFYVIRYVHLKFDYKWFLNMIAVVIIAIVIFNFGKNIVNPFLLGGLIMIVYSITIFFFFFSKEDKDLFRSLSSSIIYKR